MHHYIHDKILLWITYSCINRGANEKKRKKANKEWDSDEDVEVQMITINVMLDHYKLK